MILTFRSSAGKSSYNVTDRPAVCSVAQAGSGGTNVAVMLKVSDGILPELATTQTLWIAVHPPELPKISQLQRIHSGWEFQVSGEAGLGYRIEASTNLVNWETLSTTNPATLPFKIFDLGPRQGARYYRALAY